MGNYIYPHNIYQSYRKTLHPLIKQKKRRRKMNQTITMVPEPRSLNSDKRALIKFSGGARQPQEIIVGPGTTASDLLKHLKMKPNDFVVSLGSPDTVFGRSENLFKTIHDGDQLFVSSKVDAGIY
jgi:hypothetical protein